MDFPEHGTPRIYDLSTDRTSVTITTPPEVESTLGDFLNLNDRFVEICRKVAGAKTFTRFACPRWGFDEGIHSSRGEEGGGTHQVFLPAPADSNPNRRIPSINLERLFSGLWRAWYRWHEKELQMENDALQLISIDMTLSGEYLHGASIQATIFPQFCERLQALGKDTKPCEDARAAMRTAYEHMSREPHHLSEHDFRVNLEAPDQISLGVPGDATILYPDHLYSQNGGYQLVPHNVDAPIQQLTLLVGLAHLCQSARAAGF